ncbi:MAG: tRNA 2-thiouridine synthesizing protein B [Candidatus Pseudothioglobus sp.]|jgi:tRNA 2-thiouridine synthesizing protein B
MLHTVNKSPEASALRQCLQFTSADDVLVLIEDGVYCARAVNAIDDWLEAPLTVYAILADVEARGLLGRIDPRVVMIDYQHFVGLCVTHPASKRWS